MTAEPSSRFLRVLDGKYGLVRELGRGGMGVVWEAVHLGTGGRVAIKLLHPEIGRDETAIGRFRREARAAAAIGHECIIAVHDIGTDADGSLYLVMERLVGAPLSELLAGAGRLDVPTTAYLACQVLSGLAATHDKGVVHRDLKPENVFLVDAGTALPRVKILDFGISRALGAEGEGGNRLTRTGTVLGTPFYMAPEHARGQPDVDGRADLYATGVILYECLTGTLPHQGDNYNAVLARILTEDPTPPSMHRPDLPPGLEAVLERAMDKDRAHRYQHAADMLDALLPYVQPAARQTIPMPRWTATDRGPVATSPTLEDAPERPDAVSAVVVASAAGTAAPARRGAATLIAVLVGLLALVTLGAGLGLAAFARSRAVRPVPSARVAAEPAPAPATVEPEAAPPPAEPVAAGPPPLDVVVVEILDLPDGATVSLDGAPVTDLPLRLRRNGPVSRLRVEAEGHEPFELGVNPTRDQEVRVVLERRPAPAGSPRPADARRRRTEGYQPPYLSD